MLKAGIQLIGSPSLMVNEISFGVFALFPFTLKLFISSSCLWVIELDFTYKIGCKNSFDFPRPFQKQTLSGVTAARILEILSKASEFFSTIQAQRTFSFFLITTFQAVIFPLPQISKRAFLMLSYWLVPKMRPQTKYSLMRNYLNFSTRVFVGAYSLISKRNSTNFPLFLFAFSSSTILSSVAVTLSFSKIAIW